jgi:radical SAM superfamily enzyme YgiQ (UPF0313 family)
MRVAIVFPHVGYCTGYRPHLSTEIKHGATYHIAQCLTYLYSTAELFAEAVRVIDFNFGSFDSNIQTLRQFNPDVVLISSTVNSFDSTRKIVKWVSEGLTRTKIFVGGPAISSNYPLRSSLVSIDAEFEYVVTNKDIFAWTEQVFGRKANVEFSTFTPTSRWILDTYPEQMRDKLRYTIITSLGCTYKCNFCLNPKVYQVEYKDLGVVRTEIEEMKALFGAKQISVADPYFFMNFNHGHKVMEVMSDCNVRWSQQTCLITLTDENLDLMGETGCASVLVGIENFFSNEIDKPVTKEMLEEKLARANKLDIKIKPSFISGLLDIDFETDVLQIEYVKSLIARGKIENNQVQANIYTPYIPDERDRLLNVPFLYWGVLPVTAQGKADWKDKVKLCDLINEEIFPETLVRYNVIKRDYFSLLENEETMWFDETPDSQAVPPLMPKTLIQIGRNKRARAV